nr:MAG TPA: hypothetical protein [Caudoviricetes sp.]
MYHYSSSILQCFELRVTYIARHTLLLPPS